jgi:CheY-like chemotaxis protein
MEHTESETPPRKKVLLVDDERVLRESVRTLLIKDHLDVVEANNGAEAYALFTQGQFDLVVTDCVMPFVSGDELAVRIRHLSPKQPILMITGNAFKRGPRNPVDAVLHKPFNYERLQAEINKLI